MNAYEFINLEGKWVTVDLEALRQVAISAQEALAATSYAKAESSHIIDMRGRRPIHRGGWKVFFNSSFAWVQVRNYDKAGREISAAKLQAILDNAGITTKLDGKRLTFDRTILEQVAA